MSRAIKSSKSGKRAPIHSGLQIRRYLVKCRRKPTGDNPPNKRSSLVLENSDWEDTVTDDSVTDTATPPSEMASVGVNSDAMNPTSTATNGDLCQMEERFHTKLTNSLTISTTENLKTIINTKLVEALNKMTQRMAQRTLDYILWNPNSRTYSKVKNYYGRIWCIVIHQNPKMSDNIPHPSDSLDPLLILK